MASKPSSNIAELSVSEIAFALKRVVEDSFGYVRIRGEISGYRGPAGSGHCYFSLKDEKARLDSVIWRGTYNKLKIKPEEGMEVVATGRLTTYPGSSKYQIVVESLEPAGIGALMALLEERKKRLAAEGLFAEDRKKPLPYLPRVIGVVTSPTGAVIRDIVHRLRDRFPVRVLVWPVRVQGETSAGEVTEAIRGFNAIGPGESVPRPDLLIVARGGGSIEDLWSFNEEEVARAAAASDIPLISAVGHETDWTLIDFVSDLRAPTPTGAAEMAVPVRAELVGTLGDFGNRLDNGALRLLDRRRSDLRALERALPSLRDLVALPRQRLDTAGARLGRALETGTAVHRSRFAALSARISDVAARRVVHAGRDRSALLSDRLERAALSDLRSRRQAWFHLAGRLDLRLVTRPGEEAGRRFADLDRRLARAFDQILDARKLALNASTKLLQALSHENALKRGFAIVRDEAGAIVRSAGAARAGETLKIDVIDGTIKAIVGGTEGPARKPQRRKRKAGEGQGSLFD